MSTKKRGVLLLVILVAMWYPVLSQKAKRPEKVMWHDWYDSAAFLRGPRPLINGYGRISDSLSLVYNKPMYEYGGKYYPINNMADYYFWFTRKYEFLFRKEASLYEELYYSGDSFGLAMYVKRNYKGKKLPVKFRFPNNPYIPYSDTPTKIDPGGPATLQRVRKQ